VANAVTLIAFCVLVWLNRSGLQAKVFAPADRLVTSQAALLGATTVQVGMQSYRYKRLRRKQKTAPLSGPAVVASKQGLEPAATVMRKAWPDDVPRNGISRTVAGCGGGDAVMPLTPGEIALVVALAAVVTVIAVWFRRPAGWVDALLLLAMAAAFGLLALTVLS
jgi:hypothetical protein